ncbi:MAG: beta-lactamase family protein [Gemmatimonadetes bacterium]|nr:beta-lactamase family protein [Gemmatimonadota bacterium]
MLLPLLAAIALATTDSTPRPAPKPPATIAELEARIQRILDSAKVPGVGLAIVRHDSIVYTRGMGKARVEPPVPATDRTLFRIGSTSKAFVALTVMALVKEGKLSLDDPLAKRLPGFWFKNAWEATDPVRIVHLLEHTSGFDDNSLKGYATNKPDLSLKDGLALDSATRVSRWRPGTRFSYCNTGPAIVALIIEQIEGKPFEQVVQERWFTPIGMATATYMPPDTTKVPAATLYKADGKTAEPYWYVFIRPAGSINANAHDMGAYVRFLLGRGTVDGKELIARASLERMEHAMSGSAARAGLTPGYGLHLWRTADSTGFTWTMHGGGVNGGLSDMSYMPELGIGYAFQINNGNAAAYRLITQAVRGYLTLGLTPPAPELPVAPLAPATRAEFGGWYRDISPRVEHLYGIQRIFSVGHVTFTDSGFTLKPLLGGAKRYLPVDSLRFRRPGEREATLAFVRDEVNGRAHGIEDEGGGLGTSYAQVSVVDGLGTALVALLFAIGLGLSVLAMLVGAGRWAWRRIRKQPAVPALAARAWRTAAALALVAIVFGGLLATASDSLNVIGTFNATTCTIWLLGWLFALGSLVAVVLVRATPPGATTWSRVSFVTARTVVWLDLVAAAYLVYWGFIGWATWT